MSDYVYYNQEYIPESFGLQNTGAICWCNSILQALLSCSALNKILLDCEADLMNNTFACEYIRLLKAIVPNKDKSEDLIKFASASNNILIGFVKQLKNKGLTFRIGSTQECTDEAFTLFIDMFDHPKVSQLFSNVYELFITCKTCGKNVSQIRDKSYKINLFSEKKLTNQADFCTYIRIHPSELDYYKCEHCGNVMINLYRIEKLKMLREIVVITFNKYHSKENKWFPKELEFGAKGGGKLKYKLVGQIEHSGGMSGGHYYSNCLRGEKWKCFNDSYVGDSELGPTPLTYMVLYHIYDDTNNNNEK